ncbi:hypothetical protein EI77_01506 [Prosthecobacter fusiformis]|uniref:Glycosyl hydrolase family 10 n=1 Tax=Prosthecobacter fusiformis TaxID=48464 RepID=A0A4R7S584_9BACT|nr:hypothetical protein EI77_01506 [Prosthecobacter fusiformis]
MLAAPLARAQSARTKAPFRVIYSNDTTNISSCVSPFHKAREPFRATMLEATVDEVAGLVDAHFLQPGLGMVPMWPSKVMPLEPHYAWIKERYGVGPDSFGNFVMRGGDVVQVFVDRCHKTNQAAFVSFRLNDAHHKEFTHPKPGDKPGSSMGMSVTRHYVDHPEYLFKPDSKRGMDLVQNWIHEDVRAQKLALITELCENYDLDGLELDYMRIYSFFDAEKTSLEQRQAIMTGFVKQVRQALDRTERNGKRRWLCVRVPCLVKGLDALGLDLPAMVGSGVDMVNISASYFTTQQMDLAEIRARVPETAALYVEMCHSIANGSKLVPGYDTFTFRRATQEQYETTAHLAYARGADGVSLFNFAYYREHGGPGRGPFAEPPFAAIKQLDEPAKLAVKAQHWFLATGWNNPYVRPPILPRSLKEKARTQFELDMAPPADGWKGQGRLRLQADATLAGRTIAARCNGTDLQPSNDVEELFENPYPSLLGKPETMRAWAVPASVLRDGKNVFEFMHQGGKPVTLEYMDVRMG